MWERAKFLYMRIVIDRIGLEISHTVFLDSRWMRLL
jgi:hypothetical protein